MWLTLTDPQRRAAMRNFAEYVEKNGLSLPDGQSLTSPLGQTPVTASHLSSTHPSIP